MRHLLFPLTVAAVVAVAPAVAGTPYQQSFVCPVDGQTFSHTATMSYSTFGMELDGLPIGSWVFPMPIPQCPDSRFPVYQEDFSDSERAAIRALVATPEYAAVKDEASYYVLRFVLARMGEPDTLGEAWLLLRASWQVRDRPETYRRYAAELIPLMDAAQQEVRASDPVEWWYMQVILANVSRQAGDAAAATARLDAIGAPPPDMEGDILSRIAETRRLIAAGDTGPASLPDERAEIGDPSTQGE